MPIRADRVWRGRRARTSGLICHCDPGSITIVIRIICGVLLALFLAPASAYDRVVVTEEAYAEY